MGRPSCGGARGSLLCTMAQIKQGHRHWPLRHSGSWPDGDGLSGGRSRAGCPRQHRNQLWAVFSSVRHTLLGSCCLQGTMLLSSGLQRPVNTAWCFSIRKLTVVRKKCYPNHSIRWRQNEISAFIPAVMRDAAKSHISQSGWREESGSR